MPYPNTIKLSAEQEAHTANCFEKVQHKIQENGPVGFDEFMQIALHDPCVGYYHGVQEIFGEEGDFTTVPETSVHLAYCLSHACAKLICDDNRRVILEIGAGSGRMAKDIVTYCALWGQLPNTYYIYEPSQTLRKQQKELIETELPEHASIFKWLSDLDCEIESAIVLANEVLDAIPIKCFEFNSNNALERCVGLNSSDELEWTTKELSKDLDAALDFLTVMLEEPIAGSYTSEINLQLEPTLSKWTKNCYQCLLFLIDYGYPRNEYYHPQRSMGTLRCYYRHQTSDDVFYLPGLQDITADVDFSALANAAKYLNLGVLSFGSQRNFMLANNLLNWKPNTDDEVEQLAQIAQLKHLTLSSDISERFQVMVLGKGIEYGADRFTMRDMRMRL